jgi:hypothetical protein
LAINLGIYQFEGPLESVSLIKETEGIFAVLCIKEDRNYDLIHVEEANNLKAKIRNHISSRNWVKMCSHRLAFGVNYTPNLQTQGRKMIVNEIKNTYLMNKREE